jgi:hypothetical protein
MGKTNRAWHEQHRMPKNPSEDERIAWRLAHAENCGCREIPRGVAELLRRRGIPVPKRPESGPG